MKAQFIHHGISDLPRLSQECVSERVVELAAHAAWSIDDAVGREVMCDRGTIWLTQEGDERDIVLKAGEQFTIDSGGRVVISGITAAAVRVG